MLLFAYVVHRFGSWEAAFDDGLQPAATIFRNDAPQKIERVLQRVETHETGILSVHSQKLAELDPAMRSRLQTIWKDRDLPGLNGA